MKLAHARWVLLAVFLTLFPFFAPQALLRSATLTAITVIGALGINVLTGVAHQFSAGHAAFIAIGAYAVAFLTLDLGLPYWIALPAAVLVAGGVGLLFSPVAFKLRHLGLALTTMGLVFVVQHVLRNVPALGGALRPKSVPEIGLLGINFGLPSTIGELTLTRTMHYYFFCVVLAALAALFTRNVLNSRHGRAMSAMGNLDTEGLAAHLGTSVRLTKTKAFVFSSMLAGLAGGLLAPFVRVLQYESFGLALSVEYLAIIIIGGMGSVTGSVLGAIFVMSLRDVIRYVAPFVPFVAHEGATRGLTIAQASTISFGLLILLLLAFQPGGLEAMWHQGRAAFSRRRGRPEPPQAEMPSSAERVATK
jgi:branched-chain amino acid transport system permease protein